MSYQPVFRIVPNDPESDPRGFLHYSLVIKDEYDRIHGRFRTQEEAEEAREHLMWERSLEMGRRVGGFLDHVRTVHSRAQTALDYQVGRQHDPEETEAYEALRRVVELLEPWKRTGRAPKRKKD